jgi:hypothetical protein
MTLLRLVQRANLLAGLTLASFSVYISPVRSEPSACIITNNGKTVCGKSRSIERMCVTTDGNNNICGKFKSAKEEQEQPDRTPAPSAGYRKDSDSVTYAIRSCRRSSSDIKCNLVITTKKTKSINLRAGKGFSSFVDPSGRTYPSTSLEYNGEITRSFSNNVNIIISPETDYIVDVNFENTPEQINKVSLLNIYNDSDPKKVIQFRNVTVSN